MTNYERRVQVLSYAKDRLSHAARGTEENFMRRMMSDLNLNAFVTTGVNQTVFALPDDPETAIDDNVAARVDQLVGVALENNCFGIVLQGSDNLINRTGYRFVPDHLVNYNTFDSRSCAVLIGAAAFSHLNDLEWRGRLKPVLQHELTKTGFIGDIEYKGVKFSLFTDAFLPKYQQFMDGRVAIGPNTMWGRYFKDTKVDLPLDSDADNAYVTLHTDNCMVVLLDQPITLLVYQSDDDASKTEGKAYLPTEAELGSPMQLDPPQKPADDEFDVDGFDSLEVPDVEIENNQPSEDDDGCAGGACKI
jgi:hypothetical protein